MSESRNLQNQQTQAIQSQSQGQSQERQWSLSIPHANERQERRNEITRMNREDRIRNQMAMIEETFEKADEGATTIEFDCDHQLEPEVTKALSEKGYSYSYEYSYSRSGEDQPVAKCHVVISSEPESRPEIFRFNYRPPIWNTGLFDVDIWDPMTFLGQRYWNRYGRDRRYGLLDF